MSKAKYIEPEILIAIVLSPRFKVKSEEFVKAMSKHYDIGFPPLPLEKQEDLIPFEAKRDSYLLHKQDPFYFKELEKLFLDFKLDVKNKTHKKVIENAIFFPIYPKSTYRPKPNLVFDYTSQTPKCSIEVHPWTKQKDVTKVFKVVQEALQGKPIDGFSKDYTFSVKGGSSEVPSYYIGKAVKKDKIKKKYLKHLKIFFIYMAFKKKFLSGEIAPITTSARIDPSKSALESVYYALSFQEAIQEAFGVDKIDKAIKWDSFAKEIPNLEKQLEEYNLFL